MKAKLPKYIDANKKISTSEPLYDLKTSVTQNTLDEKGIFLFKWMGYAFSQGEILTKYKKYIDEIEKVSFQNN